jgi:hypothetical protein
MRKGFLVTLSAIATLCVASAGWAIGPVVTGIPDVWITQNDGNGVEDENGAGADANIFRYTSALNIVDYVEPTSGTVAADYWWGWAAKDLNTSAAYSFDETANDSDNFVSPGNTRYDINGVSPLDLSGGAADIDGNAAAINAGVTSAENVDTAGVLSFQDIFASPLPLSNAPYDAVTTPVSVGQGSGSGILNAQEATLFVVHSGDAGTTVTPGADTFLMVTVDVNNTNLNIDRDITSPTGPTYTNVLSYTDLTTNPAWASFGITTNDLGNGVAGGSNSIVVTINAGSMTMQTPLSQSEFKSGRKIDQYSQAQPAAGLTLDPALIYRFRADVAATNDDTSDNPTIYFQLNGRTGGPGLAFITYNPGATNGAKSAASTFDVYARPTSTGTVFPVIAVLDGSATLGETYTFTNVGVDSVPAADLSGENVLLNEQTFNTGADANTAWLGFAATAGLTGGQAPTTVLTPTSGSAQTGVDKLTIQMSGTTSRSGLSLWAFNSHVPQASADKLVVVDYSVVTTSADSANIPEVVIFMPEGNGATQSGLLRERINDGSMSPTVAEPVSHHYVVYDTDDLPSAYTVQWDGLSQSLSTSDAVNGEISLDALTVTEYDLPLAD